MPGQGVRKMSISNKFEPVGILVDDEVELSNKGLKRVWDDMSDMVLTSYEKLTEAADRTSLLEMLQGMLDHMRYKESIPEEEY